MNCKCPKRFAVTFLSEILKERRKISQKHLNTLVKTKLKTSWINNKDKQKNISTKNTRYKARD